ncbi:MAG: MATE family efflux transporter, partial [Balneolales bacterium]|nr:MATE family efflux transporter [Balneolales bacterium]
KKKKKSTWITAFVNMIFLAAIGITFYIFAESLMRIFTEDAAIIEIGAKCLRIISYGYIAYAFGMVVSQAFNGAGDTFTPTLINFICFWLIEIPLAYYLALQIGWGDSGVYYSVVVAEVVLAILAIALFKRGKWKQVTV